MATRMRFGRVRVTVLEQLNLSADMPTPREVAYSRYKLGCSREAAHFASLLAECIGCDLGERLSEGRQDWAVVTPPSGTLRTPVNAVFNVACRIGAALDLPVLRLKNVGRLPRRYGEMAVSERRTFPFQIALDVWPVPQNAVFVDDVVVSGSTIAAAVRAMREAGVRNISAYVMYQLQSSLAQAEATLDGFALRGATLDVMADLLNDAGSEITSRMVATVGRLKPQALRRLIRRLDPAIVGRLYQCVDEVLPNRDGVYRAAFKEGCTKAARAVDIHAGTSSRGVSFAAVDRGGNDGGGNWGMAQSRDAGADARPDPRHCGPQVCMSQALRDVRAVVTDVDGTIWRTPTGCINDVPNCKAVIDRVLSKQIPIAFITEARAAIIWKKFWRFIPSVLRRSLYLFTDGGGHGLRFSDTGKPRTLFRHGVATTMRRTIVDVVRETYRGDVRKRFRIVQRRYKVKLDLVHGDLDGSKLEEALGRVGSPLEVVHEPGRKISIYPFGKRAAAAWFCEEVLRPAGISPDGVIVFGDQVHKRGGDRLLFEYFEKAVRVNVGARVRDLPGGVLQYPAGHEEATAVWLKALGDVIEQREVKSC